MTRLLFNGGVLQFQGSLAQFIDAADTAADCVCCEGNPTCRCEAICDDASTITFDEIEVVVNVPSTITRNGSGSSLETYTGCDIVNGTYIISLDALCGSLYQDFVNLDFISESSCTLVSGCYVSCTPSTVETVTATFTIVITKVAGGYRIEVLLGFTGNTSRVFRIEANPMKCVQINLESITGSTCTNFLQTGSSYGTVEPVTCV